MGLRPWEVESCTIAELVELWNGYTWRREQALVPAAMQTFQLLALFNRDVTYPAVWEQFRLAAGLAHPDDDKDT